MKKTPWIIAAVSALCAVMLAFLGQLARGVDKLPQILQTIGRQFQPDVSSWLIFFGTIGAILPLLDKAIGSWKFRKEKAQKVLDKLVAELLENAPERHRVTLFRSVYGLRAWGTFLCRIWYHEEKWRALRDAVRVNPLGLYLYVYVRPKRSWNPRSLAFYRVYRHLARDCEGVAGLVWQARGVKTVSVEHSFPPGSLRKMNELDEYDENTAEGAAILAYARATNIRSARQLRAREHYGRHFYGTVIESETGDPWGVLLLDSIAETCPMPESKKAGDKGAQFNERFDSYAELLGTLMT